ncbi:MAG TPA: hypothetical protein DIT07_03995 [Sphingobacteriaceae bacterium]|nr:hypothetical protein [Sphingobacteriaceae bacterium]
MIDLKTKLRIESSKNRSGKILNQNLISKLKESDYYVENQTLDGDAPKQFIKAYLYKEDSGVLKRNPKTWDAYIAKSAEKWYPHESVVEYMINKIGKKLGLYINEVELLQINTQIRFLSKYFLTKNEILVHGAEICGQYIDDDEMAAQIANDPRSARELFTFEFICEAIRSVFPQPCEDIIDQMVKMITFDALVGNNDRHFYNWGIITTKKKTGKAPVFAPLYDSARGLLWNKSDANVINYKQIHESGGKKIINYIDEASPRISIEGNSSINHFGLIEFLKKQKKEYKVIIEQLASPVNESLVLDMLKEEFYPFFIKERCELITTIINERFKRVRGI